jgi:hypothetical protein
MAGLEAGLSAQSVSLLTEQEIEVLDEELEKMEESETGS